MQQYQDITVMDQNQGYITGKKSGGSGSGGGRGLKIGIILLVLLFIIGVICAIVALALIPVYLNGTKTTTSTITIDNVGELDVIRRSIHFRALPNLTETSTSVCYFFKKNLCTKREFKYL